MGIRLAQRSGSEPQDQFLVIDSPRGQPAENGFIELGKGLFDTSAPIVTNENRR
jgi:hypothetical protein